MIVDQDLITSSSQAKPSSSELGLVELLQRVAWILQWHSQALVFPFPEGILGSKPLFLSFVIEKEILQHKYFRIQQN